MKKRQRYVNYDHDHVFFAAQRVMVRETVTKGRVCALLCSVQLMHLHIEAGDKEQSILWREVARFISFLDESEKQDIVGYELNSYPPAHHYESYYDDDDI